MVGCGSVVAGRTGNLSELPCEVERARLVPEMRDQLQLVGRRTNEKLRARIYLLI